MASSFTGARPSSAASATSRANTPIGVSASASPPESSTGTFQRDSAAMHAARQRAVRRHQRGGLARSCPSPGAARSRWPAPPPRRWPPRPPPCRCSAASACAAKSGSSSRACHSSLAAAGRSASDANRSRPCAAGCASARHRVARDADPPQQRMHGELRMAVRGLLVARRSSSTTASSRSVSSPGSTTAPCGSLAIVASSAAVAGIEPVEPAAITGPPVSGEPRLLGLDQLVAPLRRLDLASARSRIAGQCSRANFRKSSVISQ